MLWVGHLIARPCITRSAATAVSYSYTDRIDEFAPATNSIGARAGLVGQVRLIAFQLDPGLGLTVPPPVTLVPFISQIAVWPLVL